MKKVLALVLAVIMVCTMAMAVTVTGVTTATENSSTTVDNHFIPVTPGKAIVFERDELQLDDAKCIKTDGKFDPTKNKVDVAFDKGSDLIASQGWVKTTEGYKYVITTKANDTAVLDDTADIIISKITVTKYGVDGSAVYAFSQKASDGTLEYLVVPAAGKKLVNEMFNNDGTVAAGNGYRALNDTKDLPSVFGGVFNYGRALNDTVSIDAVNTTAFAADTIYKFAKGAKPTTTEKTYVKDTNTTPKATVSYTVKVGQSLYFHQIAAVVDYNTLLSKAVKEDIWSKGATVTMVVGGTPVATPNAMATIAVDGQKAGAALYMVNADGSLTNLNAKFDDNGVLKATANVTSIILLSDKALVAANTSTETGTTTNPGTGANDVVGVAAALAVVALVSGAAISLKK